MIFNISIVEVHHNMLKMNKLGEDVPAGPGHWRLHALGSTRARDRARRVRQPGDHHANNITRGRAVPHVPRRCRHHLLASPHHCRRRAVRCCAYAGSMLRATSAQDVAGTLPRCLSPPIQPAVAAVYT